MNPIYNLVKWRLYKLQKDLAIDFEKYIGLTTNAEWRMIQKQLILRNYIIDTCTDNFWNCFVLIKNIIWHSIINYKISDGKFIVSMPYVNYSDSLLMIFNNFNPHINHVSLLNQSSSLKTITKNNLDQLLVIIINYIILIDHIVTDHLIHDLFDIIKWHMFNAMLIF